MNVVRINQQNNKKGKVIPFKTDGVKLRKDGKLKQTPNNSIKGKPKMVYPFRSKDEIEKMKEYFNEQIEKAYTKQANEIANRNLMLFTVGINIGLRAGDLTSLKWNDVFNEDGSFKKGVRRREEKTSKYKTFFFNDSCKDAFTTYINNCSKYGIKAKHSDYLFRSREGGHITVDMAGKIIKKAAKEVGIKANINSHSLRKTFGKFMYENNNNSVDVLTHIQRLFNHDSQKTTLSYIGLEDKEAQKFYDNLNL